MIYSLLEVKLHKGLVSKGLTILNSLEKDILQLTLKWVFNFVA